MNLPIWAKRARKAAQDGMGVLLVLALGSVAAAGPAWAEDPETAALAASANRPVFSYLFTPDGRHRLSVDGRYDANDCDDSPLALSGDLCAERGHAGLEVKGSFWQSAIGVDSRMDWRPPTAGMGDADIRPARGGSGAAGFAPSQRHAVTAELPAAGAWRLRSHASLDDTPLDGAGGTWRRDLILGADAHGPAGRIGWQSRQTGFAGDTDEHAVLDHRLTWRGDLPLGMADGPLVPDWLGLQFDHVTFAPGAPDALDLQAWRPADGDADAVEHQSAMLVGWTADGRSTRLELRRVSRWEGKGGALDTHSIAVRREFGGADRRLTGGMRVSRPSEGALGYRGEFEAGLGERQSFADRLTGRLVFDHLGGTEPTNRAEVELRGRLTGVYQSAFDQQADHRPFIEIGLGIGLSDRGEGLDNGFELQDVAGRVRGGWRF
ncbi:hypothetical protein [Marinivivus vitaminiproducens]|uniref:hypothetical protein n=1 Tax=Marinivivus vitaminiproducens TaxID=3035935 RepID=UPI0027A58DAB|nr:hypothetical protein P4R82_13000 [Geminicoccaceae bacterium SCSIO 64248]